MQANLPASDSYQKFRYLARNVNSRKPSPDMHLKLAANAKRKSMVLNQGPK